MKRNFLIISCLLLSNAISGHPSGKLNHSGTSLFPLPKVDRRIGLISIVFRLAGNIDQMYEIKQ